MLIILWMQILSICDQGMTGSILRNMRYGPGHKAEVHERIVKDSSRRVRLEGLAGAGVASVMRDTGLTHGGFYKHFASKDELLLEAVRQAFEDFSEQLIAAAEQGGAEAPWRALIRSYLSVENCRKVEDGCPLSALAPEMARAGSEMRGQFAKELVAYKDRLAPFMPGRRTVDKERNFFVIFSTMMGAIEIARILPERAAQERVLSATREFLLSSF
jgi:TetR/AcrR family transcriptional regulator, transcriptional repressor for nem operon